MGVWQATLCPQPRCHPLWVPLTLAAKTTPDETEAPTTTTTATTTSAACPQDGGDQEQENASNVLRRLSSPIFGDGRHHAYDSDHSNDGDEEESELKEGAAEVVQR